MLCWKLGWKEVDEIYLFLHHSEMYSILAVGQKVFPA